MPKGWKKDRGYVLPNGDWVREYKCIAKIETIFTGLREAGDVLRVESYVHHLKHFPKRELIPKNKYRVWAPLTNRPNRWFHTEKAAMNFAMGYMKNHPKGE